MPLAFDSKSHGIVAFGFFNIASDLLLLENRFFFADLFSRMVEALASSDPDGNFDARLPGFVIDRREDVGDLMAAIRGIRFTGFIGETYRHYPFPKEPEKFKQDPDGDKTQAIFRDMIVTYARPAELRIVASLKAQEIAIDDITFDAHGFQELVNYVWQGGYPRWRDDVRPLYVTAMADRALASRHWVLAGLAL